MSLQKDEKNAELLEISANIIEIADALPEKEAIIVHSENEMERPPPAYTLTSPCLPPTDIQHQLWPPEPPPPFDGLPPYPAGPRLVKTEYPKSIPGPTYACPHCEGRFLYHRPVGLVECPFCYEPISIGRYMRIRAVSHMIVGLFFVLASISMATITITAFDASQSYFFFIVAVTAILGFILLIRAAYIQSNYRETERIEF